MTASTLAGVPFALACLGILVYCACLLVGALGFGLLDQPAEDDDTGPEAL